MAGMLPEHARKVVRAIMAGMLPEHARKAAQGRVRALAEEVEATKAKVVEAKKEAEAKAEAARKAAVACTHLEKAVDDAEEELRQCQAHQAQAARPEVAQAVEAAS